MSNIPTTLSFEGTDIHIIDHNGQPWLTSEQIGIALGLKHARTGIHKIFKNHADEFTSEMTGVVDTATPGGKQETRIYSPRGAHLLGMWCQTSRAKTFRRWALDVLEGLAPPVGRAPTPVDQELLATQRKLIDAQESKIREVDALAKQEIGKAQREAAKRNHQLSREVVDLENELKTAERWHEYAVWALSAMDDDEAIFIESLRGRCKTWTQIARDYSYRSAASLSGQYRKWQANRLVGGAL